MDFDTISNLFILIDNMSVNSKKKTLVDAISCTTIWFIWKYRNDLVFASGKLKNNEIMDAIKEFSFLWYSNINIKCFVSWVNWLNIP